MPMLRLALLLVLCGGSVAQARKVQTFNYPFTRVWASAVRMLRVDFNSAITEKDKEDGYFLFDFEHEGARHPGSVELIRVAEKGVPEIQVVMQVPAMPSYVEQMLLDRLVKKLETEYGPPREAKPVPPPDNKPKPDQGAGDKPKDGDRDGDRDAKKREKTPAVAE
jgi:hypothetical protein